jgi:hypothetical protein
MPNNLVLLLELGVNIMGKYYDSRNLIFFIEHNHLESTSFIEFELNFQTTYLWVYLVNTFLIVYIFWKFILELIYSPALSTAIMELFFFLNFISIYSMEFSLGQSLSKLMIHNPDDLGYAELIDAYSHHSMLYSRYFIHGLFLFIKVFEVLMFNKVVYLFFCLMVSFCKNLWKMVKLWIFVFSLKILIWAIFQIFRGKFVKISVSSILILFCKFESQEDYIGISRNHRVVLIPGLLHVLVQKAAEKGSHSNNHYSLAQQRYYFRI